MNEFTIKQANIDDVHIILSFIKDLAEYENMSDQVVATEELLKELARIAVSQGCGRLEWSCLDWNQPSIDFYLSLEAVPMDEWTQYRLTGDTLKALAK